MWNLMRIVNGLIVTCFKTSKKICQFCVLQDTHQSTQAWFIYGFKLHFLLLCLESKNVVSPILITISSKFCWLFAKGIMSPTCYKKKFEYKKKITPEIKFLIACFWVFEPPLNKCIKGIITRSNQAWSASAHSKTKYFFWRRGGISQIRWIPDKKAQIKKNI